MDQKHPHSSARPPCTVLAARVLLLLHSLLWLVFGGMVVLGILPLGNVPPWVLWGMASLSWVVALSLAGLSFLLLRRSRLAWFLLFGLLTLISLAALADDLGWPDLAFLVFNAAPMVLLLKDRAWYLDGRRNTR